MANPLTAKYGTVHGIAVGLSLPWVMKFNSEDSECQKIYADLARTVGLAESNSSDSEGSAILINRVEELLEIANLTTLKNDLGFEETAISELAGAAAKQWTAGFNPRKIEAEDFKYLYQQLFQFCIKGLSFEGGVV